MRGFLILGTILATLIGWLFWAAPAKAYAYVSASTLVGWQGTLCVTTAGLLAGDGTDVTFLRVVN